MSFPPNLDAMEPTDLRTMARQLRRLAHYCDAKAGAMLHRTEGQIVAALNAENFCDLLYEKLPQEWRW